MKSEKSLVGLCQSCLVTLGFSGKQLEESPRVSRLCDHCHKTSTIFYVTEAVYEVATAVTASKDPLAPLSFTIETSKITCTYRTGCFMIYLDKTFLYSTPHIKERDEFLCLLVQRLGRVIPIKSCDHAIVHWIYDPDNCYCVLKCFLCGTSTNITAKEPKQLTNRPFRINFFPEGIGK